MAEIVTIGGQQYKKRNPWGVWALSIITIGIYYFVWHYKVNDEARRYLGDETIKPGLAVLAVTLGALLLIPPYVSIYRTAERVDRMQRQAGTESRIIPILALLAAFVLALNIPYVQSELNKAWAAALVRGSATEQPGGPGQAAVPPPPPPAPEA